MGARSLGANGQTRYGERVAAWELSADTRSAARARTLIRETLIDWGVTDGEDVADVVLMVDELVTNAVVHGTGPVRLRLSIGGHRLRAEVTDGSPAPPRPSGVDAGGLDWSEAGRGLLLVTALATDFGVRPAQPGKTVWFTRQCAQAPGDPAQAQDTATTPAC